MKSAVQKAAAALGRIKSRAKAEAARINGLSGGRPIDLNSERQRSLADAEVMRAAIGRSVGKHLRANVKMEMRKAANDPQRELQNDFSNKQKGK